MPVYSATGINVGSINLGEQDKLLTIYTKELGLIKAVAKGARKPGSKIGGKAQLLCVNNLQLSKGKSLDIISQAESIETFGSLRNDLTSLYTALYFAELTAMFASGLEEDAAIYFDFLISMIERLNKRSDETKQECNWIRLCFELGLLKLLGLKPELNYCVNCRNSLSEYSLGKFNHTLGGIICNSCLSTTYKPRVSEDMAGGHIDSIAQQSHYDEVYALKKHNTEITPMVWKHLILANTDDYDNEQKVAMSTAVKQALNQSVKLSRTYIEHRAGRQLKSLDVLDKMPS